MRLCRYCAAAPATAMDHVWPKVLGGTDDSNNLVPACARCNSSKGGRSIINDLCPECWKESHPSQVDCKTGTAVYACLCGNTWQTYWSLQQVPNTLRAFDATHSEVQFA